ncbi:hypothetical protein Trichorick_00140 [Candidatus Trichorickettsia mobilis]|uniref:Uncharacterized protein n=1 Tax=Candidatus Trichorickettsia mobilis TaxID=1346319 RepID=A0ABZ0URJ4_9RICK|nr:hypothetical protein [Candidatus Trichorickettsia mobilis]WPY00268.1 hypothetical protein Trichorick_00140 [Candidatus Trichorickettsia mobilis]
MFKIFTITLLLLINLSSAKGLTQPQPLVLTNKSYNYTYGDYSGRNFGSIEFNEFTTGKKYCKRYTEDWDEQCQDAVMYHVYGKNWRKFKRVALKFVRAVQKGDSKTIASLCTTPMTIVVYRGIWDVEDEDQIYAYIPTIQDVLQDAQYKNFAVQEWGNILVTRDLMPHYAIYLVRGVAIAFECNRECNNHHFIPKILIIRY